jgi:hypothetical protein
MTIYVMMKQPSNLHKQVKAIPMTLPSEPHTLHELIAACAEACVRAYRERAEASSRPAPLSDEAFADMEALGKFAFGVHYNHREVDLLTAIETARQAVEDGLVRIFSEDGELTDPDAPLHLAEGATLTFIRLAMLTGQMW